MDRSKAQINQYYADGETLFEKAMEINALLDEIEDIMYPGFLKLNRGGELSYQEEEIDRRMSDVQSILQDTEDATDMRRIIEIVNHGR